MCEMIVRVEVPEDNIMSSPERLVGCGLLAPEIDGQKACRGLNAVIMGLFQSINNCQAPAACLTLAGYPRIQAHQVMLKEGTKGHGP